MKIKTSGRSGNVVFELGAQDSGLPPVAIPDVRLRQILVPVDFSECSRKAFHYAVQFARQFSAELMLLHVVEFAPIPPQPVVLEAFPANELTAANQEEAAKHLSEWRNTVVPGLVVKAVTRIGMAAHQEIIDAAKESNTDLIVIGNHGRTGIARLVMGGTTEKVVRHAPCPVLVIREREHDFMDEPSGQTDRR